MPELQTPEQLNIKAPAGGFQQGGWYEGRQYWDGKLSNPGVINPLSTQQGAGQAVSGGVVRASSVAAGKDPGEFDSFLSAQNAKPPRNKEEVTPYLNNFQNDLIQAGTSPEVRGDASSLRSQLTPKTGLPAQLDRVGKFEELRTSYGVSELETQLTDLKAQEDKLSAEFRKQRFTEEGKPVPLNVIEGRISEEERQYLERSDYLGRQVARITDELNTKYNVISIYMNLANLDYQDAVNRYETEFNQNMQIHNAILGQRKEARSAFESDRAAASANLKMYYNAITSGNVDYGSLGADQQIMVNKLEAQAGLPIGFLSTVRMDTDANILFTTSNEGVTQIGIRNADGSISVQSHGTRVSGGVGKMSDVKYKRESQSEMTEFLSQHANQYGHVDPSTYIYARRKWIAAGNSPDNFDSIYRTYRDPNRTDNAYNIKQDD